MEGLMDRGTDGRIDVRSYIYIWMDHLIDVQMF